MITGGHLRLWLVASSLSRALRPSPPRCRWTGLGVFSAYALVAIAAAVVAIDRRDA